MHSLHVCIHYMCAFAACVHSLQVCIHYMCAFITCVHSLHVCFHYMCAFTTCVYSLQALLSLPLTSSLHSLCCPRMPCIARPSLLFIHYTQALHYEEQEEEEERVAVTRQQQQQEQQLQQQQEQHEVCSMNWMFDQALAGEGEGVPLEKSGEGQVDPDFFDGSMDCLAPLLPRVSQVCVCVCVCVFVCVCMRVGVCVCGYVDGCMYKFESRYWCECGF